MRITVDLPAPLGPSSAVTPAPMVKRDVADGDDAAEELRHAVELDDRSSVIASPAVAV